MKRHQPEEQAEFTYDYFDPDSTFDDMLEELDQVDLLDEDVQRLTSRSIAAKCISLAALALLALLNRQSPLWLAAIVVGVVGTCWILEAFWLRRRRLEVRLQKDILNGAPLAPDLRTATLRELYPGREMHYSACFLAREIFGFYCPFLAAGLLLTAFSTAGVH